MSNSLFPKGSLQTNSNWGTVMAIWVVNQMRKSSKKVSEYQAVVQTALTVFVLGIVSVTVWKLAGEYNLAESLTGSTFLMACLLATTYRIVNPLGWAFVLRGLGFNVDSKRSCQIWLLAESRRWLPGGIWGYTSRAVAAKQSLGVPTSVASASMLLELLLTIVAAAIVGFVGLVCFWDLLSSKIESWISWQQIGYCAIGATAFLMLAFTARKRFYGKVKSLLGKVSALKNVSVQPLLLSGALGYLVAMACLNGVINQTLLPLFSSGYDVPLVAMIAATATAWIVGFFAFFSPGGILVREAALAALLLPWLPYETGFLLAILSRVAQLVAEVVGMLWAIYYGRNEVANELNVS